MDKRRAPTVLVIVALLQVLPLLVLPPDMYRGIGLPLWLVVAALFGLLGFYLLRLREWARVASNFVQGLNIIVRLLTLLSNTVPYGRDAQLDAMFLATSLVSMLLSAIVLYFIDQPDIQLVMQR